MKKIVFALALIFSSVSMAELSSRIQSTETKKSGVSITVEKASFAKKSPIGIEAKRQKKFLILEVTIENNRHSDLWVSPYKFYFIDHQDEQTRASTYHHESLSSIELMPGTKTSGYITIEVPFLYEGGTLFYEYETNRRMGITLPRRIQG